MTGTQTVNVFIRRAADKHDRVIAFIPPSNMSVSEILEDGWAIDGNQAIRIVSLHDLPQIERQLIEGCRQKGHEIQFC